MDLKRLRLQAIDDPAFMTAVQAAAAQADSVAELERLLNARGWPVDVVELGDPGAVDEPALDVRRLDVAASTHP